MAAGKYLNFGCGGVFHPAWVNIDMSPISSEVMACDLTCGLPFTDGSFDAVYSSHVLEHFDPKTGTRMLRECHRVLAAGGTCRVVVPDLASQATIYLEKLRKASLGNKVAEGEYDWAVLELIDQMVRTRSGGLMHEYLETPELPASEFVAERIGKTALANYRSLAATGKAVLHDAAPNKATAENWRTRLAPRRIARAIGKRTARPPIGQLLDRALQRFASGATYALSEAAFRQSGESHRWAYDAFSLKRAFVHAGFASIETYSYNTSGIPNFALFGLDTNETAEERRPHSIYMEGRA